MFYSGISFAYRVHEAVSRSNNSAIILQERRAYGLHTGCMEDKLLDMYPDIRAKGLTPRMSFDQGKDAWSVTLKKGTQEHTVYLCKTDADACMDSTYC